MFKQLISKNFRSCTIQTLYRQLLNSQDLSLQYPNIAKLLTIALTLPVSTVDCERGFSRHNLIKTRLRSRLLTKNVSTLMKIAIDTPDIQHMNNFSFHRAFIIWCSQKDRLIANSWKCHDFKCMFFIDVFLARIYGDWLKISRQCSHFGYNFFLAWGNPDHIPTAAPPCLWMVVADPKSLLNPIDDKPWDLLIGVSLELALPHLPAKWSVNDA